MVENSNGGSDALICVVIGSWKSDVAVNEDDEW